MKKCPFCAEEVQDEAVVCKHCGRELAGYVRPTPPPAPPPQRSGGKPIAVGCLLLVILGSFGAVVKECSGPNRFAADARPSPATEHRRREREARAACRQFVLQRLKAPATADFLRSEERFGRATDAGPEDYRVLGAVDAQNSFGAMIRSRYECVLRNTDGRWTLQGLEIQ